MFFRKRDGRFVKKFFVLLKFPIFNLWKVHLHRQNPLKVLVKIQKLLQLAFRVDFMKNQDFFVDCPNQLFLRFFDELLIRQLIQHEIQRQRLDLL